MSHELAYFLKVNVAIALFYAFYRLFFYKDTFFQWRRIALLSFFAISLLYPLLNIEQWIKAQEPMVAMVDLYSTIILPEIVISPSSSIGWKAIITSSLSYIYIGVAILLLLRFFIQLFEIIRIGLCTSTATIQGTKVHLLPKTQGPFSFFKWIFICPDTHSPEEVEEILTHERTHAQQWHSLDIVLSELVCIVCWINPFIWLMKREIRNNLEFMADHKVLETGHDCKTYQYHLLGLTHQKKVATLYNNFNVLPLKIRIRMMNKKRTRQIGRTKYLMFLPLAALLLLVSNIEAIARSTEALVSHVVQTELEAQEELSYTQAPSYSYYNLEREYANIDPGDQTPQKKVDDNDVVFEIVEQMPDFPGGQAALMKYIAANIQYPAEAKAAGEQGRVILQFIIDAEGNITQPRVVRSVSPSLDQEAIRLVNNMGKWIPGKQRGKAVAVKYALPVNFTLSK